MTINKECDGPEGEPECDCIDYEADILTGMATCPDCGHRWVQTADEIERERQAQIDYDAMCDQWERERRSIIGRMRRIEFSFRQWWHRPAAPRDDIPF